MELSDLQTDYSYLDPQHFASISIRDPGERCNYLSSECVRAMTR